MVPGGGLEPPTRGFSIPAFVNKLLINYINLRYCVKVYKIVYNFAR